MPFDLIAQDAATTTYNSELLQFLNTIDKDLVGACMILMVIGFFGSIIAISCTWIEARKKVKVTAMQQHMVDDLLRKGYSADDIEKLVYGQTGWSKFCSIFKGDKKKGETPDYPYNSPAPPVKQTA